MAVFCDPGAQVVIALYIDFGFAMQDWGLRVIKRWPTNHLAVDEPVQRVQRMGFGGHAFGQRELYGGEHGLFIVVQGESRDVDHLSIPTGLAQHMILQLSEGRRQFQEGCAIPEGPRCPAADGCIRERGGCVERPPDNAASRRSSSAADGGCVR